MFETIKSLPELSKFRPDLLYRRMCAFVGENPMLEEWITDGAVDAYMDSLQSGDWSDVAKRAYLNGWKRSGTHIKAHTGRRGFAWHAAADPDAKEEDTETAVILLSPDSRQRKNGNRNMRTCCGK